MIEIVTIEIVTKILSILLSWPVAAVIIAILFRKPLVGLLNEGAKNIKKIKVSELEVEFVDTALGKINQSRTAVDFPINNITFENKSMGFRISYPVQSQIPNWNLTPVYDRQVITTILKKAFGEDQGDALGRVTYLLLVWNKSDSRLDFTPGINVIVAPNVMEGTSETTISNNYIIGKSTTIKKSTIIDVTTSIDKYNPTQIYSLLKIDAKNLSYKIDTKNNSAVYEFERKYETPALEKKNVDCHHVSRNILSNGLVYTSTATWKKGEPDQYLIAEMNKVLNSFTVLPSGGAEPES